MIFIDADQASEMGRKMIPIRDANNNYNTMFYVEDGRLLSVRYPDGQVTTLPCKYIDPYHFMYGNWGYHVDQFAEGIRDNFAKPELVEPITELSLYRKIYADRSLKNKEGKVIPYRAIIGTLKPFSHSIDAFLGICPEADKDRRVCFRDSAESTLGFYSVQEAKDELLSTLPLPGHERKHFDAVLSFVFLRKEHPGIDEKIAFAQKKARKSFDNELPQFSK